MIKLRCFCWEDAPFVKSVLLEVQAQYQAHLPGYIEGLSRYIDRRDLTAFGTLRIIECNGEPIGWLAEKRNLGDTYYLAHFYILQSRQGNGLGSTTLNFYMQTLKNLGVKELSVDAHRCMPRVIQFYERLGFNQGCINERDEEVLRKHFIQMTRTFEVLGSS